MKRIDFSLVLPCYNEVPVFTGSVRRIVAALDRSGYSYEVIFVDDASSDGTQSLIREAIREYKAVRAIFHPTNTGRGQAVRDGIEEAIGETVGYIDIDLEVSPVYIAECVDLISQYEADVVVGKRIYRTTPSSLLRELTSIGYQKLADVMIGTGRIDTESGYKFFHREKILPVLGTTRHPHWFWDTEVIVRARNAGLRIREVPVLFLRRFDKQSSVHVVKDTLDYLVSLWRYRSELKG